MTDLRVGTPVCSVVYSGCGTDSPRPHHGADPLSHLAVRSIGASGNSRGRSGRRGGLDLASARSPRQAELTMASSFLRYPPPPVARQSSATGRGGPTAYDLRRGTFPRTVPDCRACDPIYYADQRTLSWLGFVGALIGRPVLSRGPLVRGQSCHSCEEACLVLWSYCCGSPGVCVPSFWDQKFGDGCLFSWLTASWSLSPSFRVVCISRSPPVVWRLGIRGDGDCAPRRACLVFVRH